MVNIDAGKITKDSIRWAAGEKTGRNPCRGRGSTGPGDPSVCPAECVGEGLKNGVVVCGTGHGMLDCELLGYSTNSFISTEEGN
jgi:hypothetical protein